jgi:hypothetical protein
MPDITPHKGSFKLRGNFVGKQAPGFLKNGKTKDGYDWKRVNFGIKTSANQIVYCQKMGMVRAKVTAYNKELGVSKDYTWEERLTAKPETGFFLAKQDWDVVEEIEKLNDGDSVVIIGEIEFSEYNGKSVIKFLARSVYPATEPVVFDNGDEGEALFTQEVTVSEAKYVKEEEKVLISAYVFRNMGKDKHPSCNLAEFYVLKDENVDFARNMTKLEYGDTLTLQGQIINTITETEKIVDEWGVTPAKKTVTKGFKVTTVAEKGDFQRKLYTEEQITKLIADNQAEKMFGSKDTSLKEEIESGNVLPF